MKRRTRVAAGFTLVEMLIVVAIISVLVAIAIPIFASQFEKAREATDIANVRSAYMVVVTSAIVGDKPNADSDIKYKNGVYYKMVDLKQKKDDWQTTGTLNIGGITSNGNHWKETPKGEGVCKVECNELGVVTIYWNGGSGYKYAMVSDGAKPYKPALDAVLKTIYDDIVADRLTSDKNHVAYVQFNNGKVSSVSCYANKADSEKTGAKGQGSSGLTAEDLNALNDEIAKSLVGTGYALSKSTERIFFDWDGNVISNVHADGNKYEGIGGQGAAASLGLVPDTGGKKISLSNKTGVWTV